MLLSHNLLSFDDLIIGFARLPLVPEVFCYVAAKLDLRPKLNTFIEQGDIKIFLPRRCNIKQSTYKPLLKTGGCDYDRRRRANLVNIIINSPRF